MRTILLFVVMDTGGNETDSNTILHRINDIEKKYYADGEDAYDMRMTFEETKQEKENEPETAAVDEAEAKELQEKMQNLDVKALSEPLD